MEIGHHTKQILVVAGIATVTIFVWSWLSRKNVPVLSTVAKMIASTPPPAAS